MDRLNIGIIGGGFIGRVHTMAFRMLKGFFGEKVKDVSLKMIAEKNPEYAKSTAARLGIDEWVGGWQELVKRDDIDLVIIGVPNYMHREVALGAIEKGKHILCEKPLALNAEDAREICEAAKAAGIKHGISFNYRKTPGVLLMKRWIDEGVLGSIISFRSSFLQDWALDENLPLDWHFQKRYSGCGVLGDLGSHIIDMARFLVGEIDEVSGSLSTRIEERPLSSDANTAHIANSDGGKSVQKGKVDVDDICDVLLRFKNGAQGSFFSSRIGLGRKVTFGIEVYGTEGSVLFDWRRRNEVFLSSRKAPKSQSGFTRVLVGGPDHPYGESIWPIPGMGTGYAEPFAVQLYEMVDAIRNDKPVSPDLYEGLKVVQVTDAVISSSEKGRWEKIG